MASREEYNKCMRPHMTGSKTKQQRKLDFCIGSKLCSSKAQTEEEALHLCSNIALKQKQQTPSATNNPCASVIDMATWVQQPGDGSVCRPCLLAPVTQWYMDVLKTHGMDNLAADLEGAVDGGEAALASKLDEVKSKVPPEVSARLKEFDCHAQLYKGEEDGN
jgi:hypothetical protein